MYLDLITMHLFNDEVLNFLIIVGIGAASSLGVSLLAQKMIKKYKITF